MNNVIIGTAGHVDHGKTSLINALTGINTDRLIEEKKRGITIELGFAYLNLPNGEKAGIIDVPGHEKFIKNMLAGAGGVDLALLVVAADEGFMPQTKEHLDILSLLHIQRGIIVITKCDMVDHEWLEEVYNDIRDNVKGTFLEKAEIVETSASTMQGIEELRNKLYDLVLNSPQKPVQKTFRLPVDRVFTVQGFGTVVTGTLIEGELHQDAQIEIFPGKIASRVRNIQVHGESVTTAHAGQRVAVNLANIKKDEIDRGCVLASPNSMEDSFMLDTKLTMIPNTTRQVKNGDTVHFHHGSNVLLAKVVLLSKEALNAGESDYAQIRLTEPLALKAQDRFVIRFYSPLETIGGGVVINPMANKLKRNKEDVIKRLEIQESGDIHSQILSLTDHASGKIISFAQLHKNLTCDKDDLKAALIDLENNQQIIICDEEYYISLDGIAYYTQRLEQNILQFQTQNKLLPGMKKHDARLQLFGNVKNAVSLTIMEKVLENSIFVVEGEVLHTEGFAPSFTEQQQKIRTQLLDLYKKAGIEAPLVSDILKQYPKQKADYEAVITSLVFEGALVQISGDFMLDQHSYNEILQKAKNTWSKEETFTLAQFRDLMQTSRKYALLLFDYWDSKKITKKIDDYRIWL
ncbi:MAG: selenocysteine-specific translation elongation factor [Eubacteriales bacterium]|nr:selenocysteine-specific translation elongation factor [Eubacteriales bacterium]